MELPVHLQVLRAVLRFIRDMDGLLSTFFGRLFPREYKITGKCLKRGVCCQQIAIHLSDGFWKSDLLRRWGQWWYEFVYHFEWIRSEPDLKVLVFRCRYLKTDGQCGIYKRRPYICRNYPQPRYFGRPEFLPGCGYQAERRNG
ncbi:hypothetical protein EBR96_06120 [bacterium]|nr:hypothetical protein [bacterium]